MILQGGNQTIQPLEVGYANRPKKAQNGGLCGVFPYMRACLALIQQPLRGDLVPLNSLCSAKTAKSSPASAHRGVGGGGATGGYLEFGPATPQLPPVFRPAMHPMRPNTSQLHWPLLMLPVTPLLFRCTSLLG